MVKETMKQNIFEKDVFDNENGKITSLEISGGKLIRNDPIYEKIISFNRMKRNKNNDGITCINSETAYQYNQRQ